MGFLEWVFGEPDLGKHGEDLTAKELTSFWIKDYNKILRNVYVPMTKDKFTEIDLIAIHHSYIFVIESKNYSGWIYGGDEQRYWTQVLKGGYKSKFYSPILQNKTHINKLSKFLGLGKDKFMSLIIFSDRCEFKTKFANTEDRVIIHREKLVNCIKAKKDINNFNSQQIDEIYEKLKPLTIFGEEQRKLHIERIKNEHAKK